MRLLSLQEQLAEETRLKIAANNKAKGLASDVDHLQQQVEDEEEAKQAFQNKLITLTQQVGSRNCANVDLI